MNSPSIVPVKYPLGFVHGDPCLTYDIGYDFRQLPVTATAFADGGEYSEPPVFQHTLSFTYHSLALPVRSLLKRIGEAVEKQRKYIETTAYGRLPLALNPNGAAWKRKDDCVDIFDSATVRFLNDYVRAHVRAQVKSPLNERILLWGLDNEWEGRTNYSKAAREGFIVWLKKAYAGSIDQLNEAWQTNHSSFVDIFKAPLPEDSDVMENPGRFLDWWHFQSEHFTTMLAGLARTANEADPLRRGVAHKSTQLTIEMPNCRERILDHALFAEQVRPYSGGYYGIDMYGHGDRQTYELNYIYHCIATEDRQPGYGVMTGENNNHSGPASQSTATQWRLLANGLKGSVLFTTGFAGGKGDWDIFSFLDAQTGKLKDKFFAASRLANHVHRTRDFWKTCVPAQGMPRVAMLLPRRDVLISPVSKRNPCSERYAYPDNHRWLFYRRLREQGYWVDVIPYTKLTAKFLEDYEALCLIGADHLNSQECATVNSFVREQGGLLLADSRAGYYDVHHTPKHQLDELLGVQISDEDDQSLANFALGPHKLCVHQLVSCEASDAIALAKDSDTDIPVYRNHAGRGTVLYFPFALGSLELDEEKIYLTSVQSKEATADSEEYAAYEGEFEISRWLARKLQQVGLMPAYQCEHDQELYRVEQPQVDPHGNCVVVVSTRAQTQPVETLDSGRVELPLPDDPWASVWWASAESNDFAPLTIQAIHGTQRYAINLPTILTAGTLYLFKEQQSVLLGMQPIQGTDLSIDVHTARVTPGESFSVTVSHISPSSELPSGTLRIEASEGWGIEPSKYITEALVCGQGKSYRFEVTPPSDPRFAKPDRLSPLTCHWTDGKDASTSAFSCVEVIADLDHIPYLLSDNASYPETYPYRIATGASYRYLNPKSEQIADPLKAGYGSADNALTNGFSSIGGQRHSHHQDQLGTTHVAQYQAREVDVLFDLKSIREVMRVVVIVGMAAVYPEQIRVLTGNDEEAFEEVTTLSLTEPILEIEMPPMSESARYVRVQISWPDIGGCLDEIEIWGR